jgi:hypothetical protein
VNKKFKKRFLKIAREICQSIGKELHTGLIEYVPEETLQAKE